MSVKVKEVRKALTAAATFASTLLAANVLPDHIAPYVAGGLGVLGVYGVWAVPNEAGE